MGETDIMRKTRMKAIADFLQKVLSEPASPRTETVVKKQPTPPLPRSFGVGTQTEMASTAAAAEPVVIPSTSAVYDSPKAMFSFEEEISDDDDDDVFVEEVARTFDTENVGPLANPYILPYSQYVIS